MTRYHLAVAFGVLSLLGVPFAGCSGGPVPVGVTGDARGAFTTGWACACPNGAATCALPCPDGTDGSCSSGQPYCNVTKVDSGTGLACACPNGQTSCSLTCPNGSAGRCDNGQVTCGGSADAGVACACPNGQTSCSVTCSDGSAGTCTDGALACGSTLKWYVTCGDPVCGGPNQTCTPDAKACPAVGSACTTKGQTCNDCTQGCGAKVVCDDHDPTAGPGGCPISSAKFKENIGYLGSSDLKRLHDEAMKMKLATYNYKNMYGNPEETHLGFIIEDNPQSLAVDRGHDRVDVYGYLSMILATTQVQEREIQKLREELSSCKGKR